MRRARPLRRRRDRIARPARVPCGSGSRASSRGDGCSADRCACPWPSRFLSMRRPARGRPGGKYTGPHSTSGQGLSTESASRPRCGRALWKSPVLYSGRFTSRRTGAASGPAPQSTSPEVVIHHCGKVLVDRMAIAFSSARRRTPGTRPGARPRRAPRDDRRHVVRGRRSRVASRRRVWRYTFQRYGPRTVAHTISTLSVRPQLKLPGPRSRSISMSTRHSAGRDDDVVTIPEALPDPPPVTSGRVGSYADTVAADRAEAHQGSLPRLTFDAFVPGRATVSRTRRPWPSPRHHRRRRTTRSHLRRRRAGQRRPAHRRRAPHVPAQAETAGGSSEAEQFVYRVHRGRSRAAG